ncbi:hypothetical protein D9M70_610380 [compost metagenome]
MAQQRGNVLADIVIARAGLERFGVFLVVRQGQCTDLGQVFGVEFHQAIVPEMRRGICFGRGGVRHPGSGASA